MLGVDEEPIEPTAAEELRYISVGERDERTAKTLPAKETGAEGGRHADAPGQKRLRSIYESLKGRRMAADGRTGKEMSRPFIDRTMIHDNAFRKAEYINDDQRPVRDSGALSRRRMSSAPQDKSDSVRMAPTTLSRGERRVLRRLFAAGAGEGGIAHPVPRLRGDRDTGAYLESLGLLIGDGDGRYFLRTEQFLRHRSRWRIRLLTSVVGIGLCAVLLFIWMASLV